ncbi:MAG: hypothetical protein JWO05_2988 [Gemmatimonadetes bacterium]|nr:hypothetical protein [Gemmatimonadota bacterium]
MLPRFAVRITRSGVMHSALVATSIVACAIAPAAAARAQASPASRTQVERMPADLETRLALSALPPTMRDKASVYLLDPAVGYQLSHEGTSGVSCLVQRTAWEQSEYRGDVYVPRCYDAGGSKTFLLVLLDAAKLRAGGMSAAALKAEIAGRFVRKQYTTPVKAGLSYMVAPVMRTWSDHDGIVHTMAAPHVMFYAPGVTNSDIGADPSSRPSFPFALQEGNAEQTFLVQLLGEAERARIARDEKALLAALCSYRALLCL